MTKSQMLERLGQSAKIGKESVEMAANAFLEMQGTDDTALGYALLTVGANITDALNNIAIILCENLPKEE